MKGHPPLYQGEPGGARPASADPLKLIQWALQNGYPVQVINFQATVKHVRFRRRVKHGVEQQVALLTVEAPAPVGEQLKGPAEDRDAFVLIHVPRAAVDEMDSPIERPTIIIPGVN